MHLCVQPVDFGWQAADMDSLDGEIDADGSHHYSGQYAHGDTRREALEGLRDIYEEDLDSGNEIRRTRAKEAIAWIDDRLMDDQPKPKNDELFELAKDIVGV